NRSARRIEPRRETTVHRWALAAIEAKTVAIRGIVERDRGLAQFLECLREFGDSGLIQQIFLIMHDAGRDAVWDTDRFAFVGRGLLAAGQKVVPVPVRFLRHDLRRDFLMIIEMIDQEARHANRPLHDIDTAGPGIQFGFQARVPRINRQQSEIDLDAGFLLERRSDFFHQRPVPGAIVSDIHQLIRFVLRQSGHSQNRGGRSRQQITPFHPLTAPDDRPATKWRWARKEKTMTGRMTSTPDAVMPPQSTPVSPPENAAISTGRVRVALLVSTAENRKSFHASCRHKMLAATSPGRINGRTT